DAPADALDDFVVKAEDRGHRAGIRARGLGHRQSTLPHERHRFFDLQRSRRRKRGELSHRVADDEIGLDPARAKCGQDSETRRDEGGLLHLRLDQLLLGGFEAKPLEIEPGSDAAPLEDVHRFRHSRGDVPAHAHLKRALAGEAECDEAPLHGVHSISAEPQVSPAPMPVISTRSPSFNRSCAYASASASGIEPAQVLPYRSTLTTMRSPGMPSFWAA